MTSVPVKRGETKKPPPPSGETPCEDRERDWSGTSESRNARDSWHHRKPRRGQEGPSPKDSVALSAPNCGHLASRTVRQYIFVVLNDPGLWYFVMASLGN